MPLAQKIKESTEKYSVHNYDRLPLVVVKSKGVWVLVKEVRGRN